MRILLFLILLISFCATSFAQKDISVSEQTSLLSKFVIGYEVGVGLQSHSQLSYSQGLFVDYKISPKWLVGTEIKYSIFKNQFYQTVDEIVRDEHDNIVAFKIVSPESARYFQFPINFSFRQKHTQLTIGLSNCFLSSVRGHTVINDPQSSFFGFGDTSSRKIEPFGFRKHHLRVHLSGAFFINKGLGVRFKIFQPITNLGKPSEEIPSGNPLFLFKDRPGGFSINLFYIFPKLNFFNQE